LKEFCAKIIKQCETPAKGAVLVAIPEIRNKILDLLSNFSISSLFESPILWGETNPDIISKGFKYKGLILFLKYQ
jgi:hypothetical protein